jgi:hypothetical protein
VAFKEGVAADLMDVCPVRIHLEEIPHDVPVALAVFGLPGGAEHDLTVREIERIYVGNAFSEGELGKPAAIRVHFIDVVVVALVSPHGEKDFVAVKANVRIAHDTFGQPEQSPCLAAPAEINALQSAAAAKAACVDLVRLKHGGGGVMILFVLMADDVQDWLTAHERIADGPDGSRIPFTAAAGTTINECDAGIGREAFAA